MASQFKRIVCSDKESVYQALKRAFGQNARVDTNESANNKRRSSDPKKPNPIGSIVVRQGEEFFVYSK